MRYIDMFKSYILFLIFSFLSLEAFRPRFRSTSRALRVLRAAQTVQPEIVQDYIYRLLSSDEAKEYSFSLPCVDIVCERLGNKDSFKCYDRSDPSQTLFVKKTRREQSSCIAIGLELFNRYVPNMTPSLYLLDEKENYILTEYLNDYETLQHALATGNVDADTARQIGTVMGRNHARSHSSFNKATLTQQYMQNFNNHDVYNDYEKEWLMIEGGEILHRDSLVEFVETIQDADLVIEAIRTLRTIMLEKKESLVHADLNCANIMVSTNDWDTDSDVDSKIKVVDFEKFSYGPTGIDLGIYLCNHYWYYAAHTSGQSRRNLQGTTRSVLEAYKSAFYIQAGNAVEQRNLNVSVDHVFKSILRDAVGFAGLFSFVRNYVTQEYELLPLCAFREFSFGDSIGWRQAVRKRQLRMSTKLLLKYINSLKKNDAITFNSFIDVMESDDKYLVTEHFTEFWN